MSDLNSKSGPLCHCLCQVYECRFKSYESSGSDFHTIVIGPGNGKHLPLAQSSNNVVHVFYNSGGHFPVWDKVWESDPIIKDGDEINFTVIGYHFALKWQIYLNGNPNPVASGPIS